MRLAPAVLLLLAVASCDSRTPAERGAQLFAPAADKLGAALAAELKTKAEKAYLEYLQKESCKDEVELGRKIGKQVLERYASALALSPEQEKELKAGKFKDVEGRKKLNSLLDRFVNEKVMVPEVCRVAMLQTQAGAEWNSGLQLEFTLRILEQQLSAPPAPH